MPDEEQLQNSGLQAIAKMKLEFVQPLFKLNIVIVKYEEADESAVGSTVHLESDWLANVP